MHDFGRRGFGRGEGTRNLVPGPGRGCVGRDCNLSVTRRLLQLKKALFQSFDGTLEPEVDLQIPRAEHCRTVVLWTRPEPGRRRRTGPGRKAVGETAHRP